MNSLLIIFGFIYISNGQKYCDPFPADSSGPALPTLPYEFQMRVEASIIESKKTYVIHEYYDYYDKKAALSIIENNTRLQLISDYSLNRLLVISNGKCATKTINGSIEGAFFGSILNSDGTESIGQPSAVFHFDNGFTQVYKGETTIRGIPVNWWSSCQTWGNSNFIIDSYFTKKGYQSPVLFDSDGIDQIPVRAVVRGYSRIDSSTSSYKEFNHEYNYFEFRSRIENKVRVFLQPDGIYCSGSQTIGEITKLPNYFQYVEETSTSNGEIRVSKIYYNYGLKVLRIDSTSFNKVPPFYVDDPVSVIHDFNSGVGYVYNKVRENCTMYSLATNPYDLDVDLGFSLVQISQGLGYSIAMRDPQKFFYLDNTYYYNGQRLYRGILCDIYLSNRTDFFIPGRQFNYSVFEWFFMAKIWSYEGIDQNEQVTPIALIITVPELGISISNNFFNYDTSLIPLETFDITKCFTDRAKITFSISFNYTTDVTEEVFQAYFQNLIEGYFLVPLTNAISQYEESLSPLRFRAPKVLPYKDKFTIQSAVVDTAPPLLQFFKLNDLNIDLTKAHYVLPAYQPEECAAFCLKRQYDSIPLSEKFNCFSFDFCVNSTGYGVCSFYNASHITDPNLVLQPNEGTCAHYTKNVDTFDSCPKETAIRLIRNSVVDKTFNININGPTGTFVNFPAIDIKERVTSSVQITNGPSGSLLNKEYTVYKIPAIYNLTSILYDLNIEIRERLDGVSISQCAKYCSTEYSFTCESFTYDYVKNECYWTNVRGDPKFDINNDAYLINFLIPQPNGTTAWYIRDPLINFYELEYKTTSEAEDLSIESVKSPSECARNCESERFFTCRSFNFCPSLNLCILSAKHVKNPLKNASYISTPICSHYSRKSINDFDELSQTEVVNYEASTKYFNISLETCAELCIYSDQYECRSLSFYIDTNTCYLYSVSLADGLKIETRTNINCNHYTRTYYLDREDTNTDNEDNGNKEETKVVKAYSSATMFGVIIGLMIGCFLIGLLGGFIYKKKFSTNTSNQFVQFKNQDSGVANLNYAQ